MTRARRRAARLAVLPAVLLGLAACAAPAGAVVLGSPEYVSPYGEGWGTATPAVISNGGVPSGVLTDVSWQGWGAPVATATARASIYKPQGGYYAARPRVPLRAGDLGTCPGESELAYRSLEFRLPPWPGAPLGPWLKWSGSLDICDYAVKDPRYDYPRRPPGVCGSIGEGFEPGDFLSVTTFQLGCADGRRLARRAQRKFERRLPAQRCFNHGCVRPVGDFSCRWYRLRTSETTSTIDVPYPVQRVACRRGEATITWWFVLYFD